MNFDGGKFTFFFGKKKDPRLPSRGFKEIPTPTFRQSELRRCVCCTPAKRTIVTLDPLGREQYTCPATHATMRYVECRGQGTYLQGGIVI